MSATGATPTFIRSDKVLLGGAAVLVVLAASAEYGGWDAVVAFVVSAGAVCLLAGLLISLYVFSVFRIPFPSIVLRERRPASSSQSSATASQS